MSNYLVVYVRLLTAAQLQQSSEDYLPFVEGLYRDMKEFCDKVRTVKDLFRFTADGARGYI